MKSTDKLRPPCFTARRTFFFFAEKSLLWTLRNFQTLDSYVLITRSYVYVEQFR